ncbi:TPA: DNA-binding protein, partial [Pseudomonas aeruginosa]|nr:DNA-binding protein [Pseudomonas aeruginosa]HEN8683483.1 DNA-binding protein [Pseudomonas aeruginosa]
RITNTQVLVDLLAVGGKPMAPTAQAPARPQAQAQAPRPAPQPQPQGQDKQDKSPDAKA